MDLFQICEGRNYFESNHEKLKDEIEQLSDEEIVSYNFQEWAKYFADKYYVEPISIFETNIERTLNKTKLIQENLFNGLYHDKNFFEFDGVRITYKIPFDGNPVLFELRPSSYILSRFPTGSFIRPYGEECGSFTLDLEYTNQELQEKGTAVDDFLRKQFENKFRSYKEMITNINSDAESYNAGLFNLSMRLLNERKKKADVLFAISNALQIPLTVSKNAPNTKPIQLQRVVRKPSPKPTIPSLVPEAYISDSDYENINNIITTYGTMMEKTARTYVLNTEEELRDHLLAGLNTHYYSATGETFRKIGKTDINIEFDNKAAFIGECKIWHGEKVFQDAIKQVLSYSTWRDLKVSVIIFNKKNQSFQAVLSKIKVWADNNTSYSQPQQNVWKCKYHRQDMNIDICLTILAFDLYVDKTQLKDTRYKT